MPEQLSLRRSETSRRANQRRDLVRRRRYLPPGHKEVAARLPSAEMDDVQIGLFVAGAVV